MADSLCVYVAVRLNTGCFVYTDVGQSPRGRQNTQSSATANRPYNSSFEPHVAKPLSLHSRRNTL